MRKFPRAAFIPAAVFGGNSAGMVEVECTHDHRARQYKIFDVNLRPWVRHTMCLACGLDFPSIQYY